MARIMAIDYGGKRCGIAVTDPLQIIARALDTISPEILMDYLEKYFSKEPVEALVVGEPFRHDGTHSEIEKQIAPFIEKFKEKFNNIPVYRVNEMFSSQNAMKSLIASGVKKKDRKNKALLDSTSATLILQDYLENRI